VNEPVSAGASPHVNTAARSARTITDERIASERAFHDARFGAKDGRAADRFYTITESSKDGYDSRLLRVKAGESVLEFGCGPTSSVFKLAARGAKVTGIDISPVAVDLAAHEAKRFDASVSFATMDAEALEFSDDTFDAVCGYGILHHLSLDRAFSEITRVLKASGRAVFSEPLGHNPFINWYRSRTPDQRTPDEHPLLLSDFALAERYFGNVNVTYYHLATLAAIPFCKTPIIGPLSRALDRLDRSIFELAPFVRRYAWYAVIEFSEPKKAAASEPAPALESALGRAPNSTL
jgi:SAM-dependent methyltransferase